MTLAELLNLVLLAVLGGLGVRFSVAIKRHNDLTAESDQHREERDHRREPRERKRSYDLDRERYEEVSAEAALRLLRTLIAGAPLPPLTDMLRQPPLWQDRAADSSQFAATWVYANEPAQPTNPSAPNSRIWTDSSNLGWLNESRRAAVGIC